MKCQKCEKPATFHITDLTGDDSGLLELHLCPDCAKQYLRTEEAEKESPQISGLLSGESEHVGKQPKRGVCDTESQTELIRLRREMKEAVQQEDYEQAKEIRDRIRGIEQEGQSGD